MNNAEGLWKCHGCGEAGNAMQLANRLGIPMDSEKTIDAKKTWIADYIYEDENGKPLYKASRYLQANGKKTFLQFRYETGGWVAGMKGARRVLYKLPNIMTASTVYIVEGEKDCETLRKMGIPATTNVGGAQKWLDEYSDVLRGKSVVILPDQDEPGAKHCEQVIKSLWGKAAAIKVVHVPQGKDITDWINAGGTKQDLTALVKQAPPLTQGDLDALEPDVIAPSLNKSVAAKPKWPEIAPEAFYGLAGEIAKTIEPYSEADPVALLANTLIGFGNVIGHKPHFKVEYSKHHTNLFAVLVGETAGGRKGTSWSTPKYMLGKVEEEWAQNCITSGLSTGEGLIYHIRDNRIEKQPIKDRGKIVEYQDVEVDAGIPDKRLLIVEEEFVSALKTAARQGNILSDVIRQAWDSHTLKPLTKTNPIKATGPHISIIGHITLLELERYLTDTEKANGFANRFIWFLVRRSKAIPNPTGTPTGLLSPLIERLQSAVKFAAQTEVINRDPQAEIEWAKIYTPLSDGKPGMFGSVVARAVPQVMRLACLYALLDEVDQISAAHLWAALALWEYAEASAKHIFGNKSGDPIADKIMAQLSAVGEMSDNDLYELFSGHVKPGERERALKYLEAQNKIVKTIVETGGRPKTIWRLA
jgi:5S rRNA maturation endonuclease (ribonuclease M5)